VSVANLAFSCGTQVMKVELEGTAAFGTAVIIANVAIAVSLILTAVNLIVTGVREVVDEFVSFGKPGDPDYDIAIIQPAPYTLLDYTDGRPYTGVSIRKASDVSKLVNAPDDFKSFIASELQKANATSPCPNPTSITVSKVRTDGYGYGAFFSPACGGYEALWARPGGVWQQIVGTQDAPPCKTLYRYGVPLVMDDDFGGKCVSANALVPYAP
jgi:hypothetical protein